MTNSRILPASARALFPLLALALAGLTSTPRALAQANALPPERMAYQGYVVDANGIPLATNAPKNYDVIFRIWNDPTSLNSTNRFWSEQQTVTIDKGFFSVILGEGGPYSSEARPALSTVFTNSTSSERWIGLTVKGIGAGGTDVNILPRLKLITSPYAFLATKAMSVDGAAVTTGTLPDARLSANVALRAGGNTFTGNQIINASLGIGTSPGRPLTVNGTGGTGISIVNTTAGTGKPFAITSVDAGKLVIKDDVDGGLNFVMDKVNSAISLSSSIFALNGGNVGIGQSSPGFPLNFANTLGDKISLYGNSGNNVGFGVQGNLLQIHSDVATADIAFGYGSSASLTETMRIKGTGNVGIGTNNPQATLHVAGTMRVESGATLAGGATVAGGANVTGGAAVSGGMSVTGAVSVVGTMTVAGAGNFVGSTPYIKFSDEKPKGTSGGTSIAGVNVRTFTTEYDPLNLGSINNSTNLVLPTGTYQCRIIAPAFRVNNHQARLRNVTGNQVLLYGTSEWADSDTSGSGNSSTITGQFTLTNSSSLVVEHFTAGANSLGSPVSASWTNGSPVEVYTVAEFWKLQ